MTHVTPGGRAEYGSRSTHTCPGRPTRSGHSRDGGTAGELQQRSRQPPVAPAPPWAGARRRRRRAARARDRRPRRGTGRAARARVPRRGGDLVARGQGRFRDGDRRPGQHGLVHAGGRHAQRGLRPADRHAELPGHPARRHRRGRLRRTGERGHRLRRRAGRPAGAGLPAGQHRDQRPVPDHQDLHHRPRPARGARRRALRVPRRAAVPGVRAARRGPGPERQRRHRALGRRAAAGHRRCAEQRRRRLGRPHRNLQRLPRAQRRLDRPAGRLRPRRHLGRTDPGQRGADRADRPDRPGRRAAAHPVARLRDDGGRRRPGRRPGAGPGLRGGPDRLHRGLARLPRRPRSRAGQRRAVAHGVRRLGDGDRRVRGQDGARGLRRLPGPAVGHGRTSCSTSPSTTPSGRATCTSTRPP